MSDKNIKISMIAGIASNHVIGRENDLIWHIPRDMRWFVNNTRGKPVIMGRKTFESIVQRIGKPLPKRLNIVISRNESYALPDFPEVRTSTSLDDALKIAKADALSNSEEEVFIIGGQQIYALGLPLADRLYLTHIDQAYEGDTFFPEFDKNQWHISFSEAHDVEEDTPAFEFKIYEKKG